MKSTLTTIFSLLMLLGWSTSTSAQCDYPAGDITIGTQDGQQSTLYQTDYVLVDAAGNIAQISTSNTFTSVTDGAYTVYAINYKNLTPPPSGDYEVGDPWSVIDTWSSPSEYIVSCADISAGLPIGVGTINDVLVSDIDVCSSDVADQTVTITNADPGATYTIREVGGGAAIATETHSGTTAADFDMTFPNGSLPATSTNYEVFATLAGCGGIVLTDQVAVTVTDAVAITTQPVAAAICDGETATFTVTADNAVSYQWQENSGGTFTDISGATLASYTTGALGVSDDGTEYQVVITGNGACGPETSTAVAVTVTPAVAITTQPVAAAICDGETATFTVAADNAASYQWQENSGGTFTDISGATSASYTTGALGVSDDGTEYQVVITGNGTCGSETSTAVAVTVTPAVAITTQPVAAAICDGETATFTVAADNAASYQWQENSGGTFADISGATSASYTTGALGVPDDGTEYQVVITGNGTCGPETSTAVAITVTPAVAITTQPVAAAICDGETATFTVAADNAASYQWQENSGGTFADISGATSASYTTGALSVSDDGTEYQVVITGNGTCGPETSTAVAVTVTPAVAITTQPVAAAICDGETATFTVAADNAASYQWQENSGGTFTDISGATSASYTTGALGVSDDGTEYQVVITGNGTCGSETSTAVAVTVTPAVAITTQPVAAAICDGETATFTVAADNAASYQWQENSGGTFADISGATSASYTTGALGVPDDGTEYQVVITGNGTCGPETSTAVAVTVTPAVAITTQPVAAAICDGETATFTVTADNAASYQWQENSGGTFADISGATSASYTTGALSVSDDGTEYQVVITGNGTCGPETSTAVAVTVTPVPVITNPGPITECGSYTLPAIAGTNLTGNEAYYNETQANGGSVVTGDITTTTTLYIYDANGSCSDEESFTITITPAPEVVEGTAKDVCDDLETYALLDYLENYSATNGTGVWTIADSNNGSLADVGGVLTYTPTTAARSGGLVTFTYTVTGSGDCSSQTDSVDVDLILTTCCNAEAPTISKTP